MSTLQRFVRPLAPLLCALLCTTGATGCRGVWDRPFNGDLGDGGSADAGEPLPPPRRAAVTAPRPPEPLVAEAPVAPPPVEVAPPAPPRSARPLPPAPAAVPQRPESARTPAGPTPTAEDRETFDEVNRMRVGRGLKPFRWNDRLFRAAYDHSAEQARFKYMGHGSPVAGRDELVDRLRLAGCGPARQWAEVVAWGYEGPASVTLGWMNSRGHRKILTDPTLEEAAFSRVGDYFTGNFASPR